MTTSPFATTGARLAELPPATDLVRVYVWDIVVRLAHWLIAGSLLVLAVTGFYIGAPYVTVTGEAGQHFVMGTMRTIHGYAAIVFTLAVLSRILWMFVGPHYARWYNFIPIHPERIYGLFPTLKFYLFFTDRPPGFVGHNPLAGATYVFVFLIYLGMIGTGLGMWAVGRGDFMGWFTWLLPVFGGAAEARWLHHVGMWLLIGFFVHHVYSAITMSVSERNGTLESIFTGFKWVRPKHLKKG